MGREFELKFRLDGAAFAAVQKDHPGLTPIHMETIYYDTPDRALRKRKWMLRRREENGVSVCTLKTPLPDGSRGEWEVRCDNIRLAVDKLCKLMGSQELAHLIDGKLQEVCSARFDRLAGSICREGGLVELALDSGRLFGGRKSCDLLELEVELKEGSDDVAQRFAEELAKKYNLVPEHRSKYARALALTEQIQE